MTRDYKPVPCEFHSHLEDLIVKAQPVMLGWQNGNGQKSHETVTILDIYTRKHEEFILVQAGSDTPFEIRLDRITL